MSFIKIFVGSIEVEVVKETLTITKENNAFIESFKVSHSTYPFLVVENDNAKTALGPIDLTSTNKKKVVAVTVMERGQLFYGELQILTAIKGFRKCNLKYASELISIANNPINTYLPTVSVIPDEEDPEPYVNEAAQVVEGSDYWDTYPVPFLGKIYPEVKFNFPTFYQANKVEDAPEAPEWANYTQELNRFVNNTGFNSDSTPAPGGNGFLDNSYVIVENEIIMANRNMAAPQLFLLSPLYYALDAIGFKLRGAFVSDPFIRRLVLLSTNDNMVKIPITLAPVAFSFYWPTGWVWGNWSNYGTCYRKRTNYYQINDSGEYAVKWRLKFEHIYENQWFSMAAVCPETEDINAVFGYDSWVTEDGYIVYEGEKTFNWGNDLEGFNLYFAIFNTYPNQPLEYDIEIRRTDGDKDFYQMHPTIELSRYCPTWTVTEYLNQCKKLFNLVIDVDDFKKTVTLDFAENIDLTEVPVNLNKSLEVAGFDIAKNDSFLLKYGNAEDTALFITKEGTATQDYVIGSFNQEISNRFKYLPWKNYTTWLEEEDQQKSGTGLMIYNPETAPFTAPEYNGQNLTLDQSGGIYDTYFKKWLKFRLAASSVELIGAFTETELNKISVTNAIYVNNQHFRVVKMRQKEKPNNFIEVRFDVESVNY